MFDHITRNLLSFVHDSDRRVSKPRARASNNAPRKRNLRLERLEDRALLSVTPEVYAGICADYPALGLPETVDALNVVEIEAANLSVASLNAAISATKATQQDDLIVLYTTDEANAITYESASDKITIDVDSTNYGSLNIVAVGSKPLTINAAQQTSVLRITGGTIGLANLTITGGSGGTGAGGINVNDAKVTVTNVAITGNSAEGNGGVTLNSGTFTAVNTVISGNTSERYVGGVGVSGGSFEAINTTIAGNSTKRSEFGAGGVGVYNDATATMKNTIISANYGGNIFGNLNSISVDSSNITGYYPSFVCAPQFDGSGSLTNADSLDLHLRSDSIAIDAGSNDVGVNIKTDFEGNVRSGKVDIGAYEYRGNRQDQPFYSAEVNTLNDSFDLDDSEWSLREAIFYASKYENITFAEGLEGTITLESGQLLLDRPLSISGGGKIILDAAQNSRVMYVGTGTDDTLTVLEGLTLQNGKVSDLSDGGGILFQTGTLKTTNVAITGNSAGSSGGGVYIGSGKFTAVNTIVAGNSAQYGGGIYTGQNFSAVNTTIAGNSATTEGGGVYAWSDFNYLTATNVVVSMNYGSNFTGRLSSESSNNIIDYYPSFVCAPVFDDDGNLTNPDSLDLHLRQDSVAINAGSNAAVAQIKTDLDGQARRYNNGTVDVGAYEFQGAPVASPYSPVVDTLNDSFDLNDDEWSLREAIYYATENTMITFEPELEGSIHLELGQLTLDKALTIDGGGKITVDADNKSRVAYACASSTGDSVILEGLTFKGGETPKQGGGIYLRCGMLTTIDATICNNAAFNRTSDYLDAGGGGVYVSKEGTFTAINTTISNNDTIGGGGGVYVCGTFLATNTNVSKNYGVYAGGVCVDYSGTFTSTNSTISENSAWLGSAGGVGVDSGTFTATNTTITKNTALDDCGGVYVWNYGTFTATNTTITENVAENGSGGGAYVQKNGTFTATNTTIAGNSANDKGGGVYVEENGTFTSNNSIILLNTSEDVYADSVATGSNNLSTYACWTGSGNRQYDESSPLFMNAAGYDYRLAPYSQAINKGSDQLAFAAGMDSSSTDVAGKKRFIDSSIDIGAYEYQKLSNAEYVTIRDAYPALNLPQTTQALHVIEIEATNLSVESLQAAIAEAGTTTIDDLIVLRTTDESNTIECDYLDTFEININSTKYGSLNIVAVGTKPLTLDGMEKSQLFSISDGNVGLANLTITRGRTFFDDDINCGIYLNGGVLTTTSTTVSNQSPKYGDGYGVYVNGGKFTATNTVISGNVCGVFVGEKGTFTATNTTIAGNRTGVSNDGTFTAKNVILTANYNDNLVNDLTSASEHNIVGYYPSFVCGPVFNDNGVLTNADSLDLRLRSDSIAIDAGSNDAAFGTPIDLDGNPRIYNNGTVDIGAYEYQSEQKDAPQDTTVVTTLQDSFDPNDDEWSLREAIFYTPCYETITFAEGLEGTITLTRGELKLDHALIIDGDGRITIDADQQSRVISVNCGTVEQPVVIKGTTLQNGYAYSQNGGGIYLKSGVLETNNATITGNKAFDGGGVYVSTGGMFTATNTIITGNKASQYGGGVYGAEKTSTTTNAAAISNNSAPYGGGIFASGKITVTNTTIRGNSATSGSGVFFAGSTFTASNSSISGNKAFSYGGGVYLGKSGSFTATNVTIAANTAREGAGVYEYYNSTFTAKNVILSCNYGSNLAGTLSADSEHNIVGYYPSFVCDPVFDDDGVLTNADSLDLRLRSDSAAIDAGSNAAASGTTIDLDGNPRIYNNGTVDIGAYEYQSDQKDEPQDRTVVTTLQDTFDPNDGEWSLREAIYYAPCYETITFADNLEGTITLTRGELKLDHALVIDGDGRITIDADQKSRVISIDCGTAEQPVVIKGTTLQNGKTSNWNYGGGIYLQNGALQTVDVTISGNVAHSGGGVYVYKGAYTAINTVIAGNAAQQSGGGVYLSGYGSFTATNATIAANTAGDGAGVYATSQSTFTAKNVVLSANYGSNLTGTLSADSECNIVGYYPSFVCGPVFDDDGVLTNADALNLRLRSDSIAIDAGSNDAASGIATDLDGNPRVYNNGTVDIGAYEYQSDQKDEPQDRTVVTTLQDSFDPDDDEWSLREAIFYASCYETITFADDLEGTITLTRGELLLDHTLVIDGDRRITIDADQKSRVISVDCGTAEQPVVIKGTTLQNGKTSNWDYGGGIYLEKGVLQTVDVTISGNDADGYGGGVYVDEGTYTAINTAITDNSAENYGGGVYVYKGTFTAINTTISGNSGGGIYDSSYAVVKLYNTILAAQKKGSDLSGYGWSSQTIEGYNTLSSFTSWTTGSNNVVYDSTKPLFKDPTNGDYSLTRSSQATNKGDVQYVQGVDYDLAGTARIVGSTVDIGAYENIDERSTVVTTINDVIDESDGEISIREAIDYAEAGAKITFLSELNGKTITLNGTELALGKSLTIDASSLANGITIDANKQSRVVSISASDVNLTGLTIGGGYLENANGAGIYAPNGVTLTNTTISGNSAVDGAGIYASGDVVLTNAVIVDNTATGNGGGVYVCGSASLKATNATISGNKATKGGGVYVDGTGASVKLYNTILAKQANGDDLDVSGATLEGYTLEGYNSLSSFNSWTGASSDCKEYDSEKPLFNNPSTGDYSLAENSQAIDVGNNVYVDGLQDDFPYVKADRVGLLRIRQGKENSTETVDVGAYEHVYSGWHTTITVTATGDEVDPTLGGVSLREAVRGASDGDVIKFEQSAETQTIYLTSTVEINKSLVIDGTGANIVVDGSGVPVTTSNVLCTAGNETTTRSQLYKVYAGKTLTLKGVTLQNGYAEFGGAIYNAGTVTLDGVTLLDNEASVNGGAVFNTPTGKLSISGNTTFNGNHAVNGGAIVNYGETTIENDAVATFDGNYALNFGGSYFGCGVLNVNGTANFKDNKVTGSDSKGGAIYNDVYTSSVKTYRGVVNIVGSAAFEGNTAKYRGGAIMTYGDATTDYVSLNVSPASSVTFTKNSAEYGGAIDVGKSAKATFSGTVNFGTSGEADSQNSANYGGAVYAAGSVSFEAGGTYGFYNNIANYSGGAICASNYETSSSSDYVAGLLQLSGSFAFEGNQANGTEYDGLGGAIATATKTTVNFESITWKDNDAQGYGKCVAIDTRISGNGSLTLKRFGLENNDDYSTFKIFRQELATASTALTPTMIAETAVTASITVNGKTTTFGAEGVSPTQLGLSTGTHQALVQYTDAEGETSSVYTLVLKVDTDATIDVRETSVANGRGVKFCFNLTKEGGQAVSVWEIAWGDGSTTRSGNLSSFWMAAHYYAANGIYDVSLTVTYLDGSSETFEAFSTQKIGSTSNAAPVTSQLLSAVFENVEDVFDEVDDFELLVPYGPALPRR